MKIIAPKSAHLMDAAGKAPGRLATEIAKRLMGKHRAGYIPNVDSGETLRVTNASKMKFSGKKIEQKMYYRHSRYGHGLKTTTMKSLVMNDPADILRRSVSRMLPKNSFRVERLKRLYIEN